MRHYSNVISQNHTEDIKKTKEMMEQQKVEERNALNDKLKAAANLRDENIKRILSRLREHVSFHPSSPFLLPTIILFNVKTHTQIISFTSIT